MNLTTAQKTTFRNWLTANASALTDDAAASLANTFGTYNIWKSNADKALVDSQVNKANFTPSDAVPASGSTAQATNDALLYNNRALLCQLKQLNCQWITQGTGSIDARVTSLRQNFKDCLTAIPAGTNGAGVDAGWGGAASPAAVRQALMRVITNYEQLFVTAATGPGNDGVSGNRGTVTNPDLPGIGADGNSIEGFVTAQNVSDIRNNL